MIRILLAAGGACAVIALGGFLGGGFNVAAAAPAKTTAASGLRYAAAGPEVPIGDALEVSGQPMRLSVFYTRDAPAKVVAFYARAFAARGVTPLLGDGSGPAHVGGFDPKDGWQRFVTAMPQADGRTMVLIGLTNPRRPPRFANGAESAGFPVPPEHRAYLGYRSADGAAESESGQFVSVLSPAALLDWYRDTLTKQGWAERRGEGSGASLVVFSRGNDLLSIAVQALGEKDSSAAFVNLTSGGAR